MMKLASYLLLLLLPIFSMGQEGISFSLVPNKNKALIGQPIQVQLRMEYETYFDPSQIGFPKISDTTDLGDFEIWHVSEPKNFTDQNSLGESIQIFEQNFTIACFDSGRFELGPIIALLDSIPLASNVASIIVLPVELDPEIPLKDIKSISEDPITAWERLITWLNNYWYILVKIVVPSEPLSITLLKRLDHLEQEKLWQNNQLKKYYSELGEIIWKHLEARYQIATFEKTSHEIIDQLKLKSIPNDQFVELTKMFELSDMVKFAKTLPSDNENEAASNIIRQFILATRTDINKSNK